MVILAGAIKSRIRRDTSPDNRHCRPGGGVGDFRDDLAGQRQNPLTGRRGRPAAAEHPPDKMLK